MRILIGRHAPSMGQKDSLNYSKFSDTRVPIDPDYAHLTLLCGQFMREAFEHFDIQTPPLFWSSQFLRAQQSYSGIAEGIGDYFGEDLSWQTQRWHIDTLLNEQSFGFLPYIDTIKNPIKRGLAQIFSEFSKRLYDGDAFTSRTMLGDAPRDVVRDIRLFMSTTLQNDVNEGEDTHVIVAHGAVMKALVMHWFHLYDLDSWKQINTPGNLDFYMIEGEKKEWTLSHIYDGMNAQSLLDNPPDPIAHIKRPNQMPLPPWLSDPSDPR